MAKEPLVDTDVALDWSRPAKKQASRLHREGISAIGKVLSRYDIIVWKKAKWQTVGFVPDLQISLGCGFVDAAFIDYVATEGSFNRDLGGIQVLRNTHDTMNRRFRTYVLVIHDEVWVTSRYIRRFAETSTQVKVISFSQFKDWLRNAVIECAKDTVARLSPPNPPEAGKL